MPPPTERLRFREMHPDDADDLFVMFSDPQARRFYPRMESPEAVRGWIDWTLRNYHDHGFGLWVLLLRDTGAFVGDCGITWQPVDARPVLEVGYHVTPRHRGMGYAVEAARAALRHGFAVTDEAEIHSIVDARNTPSIRVATRVHAQRRELARAGGERRLLFSTARVVSEPHD